MIYSKLACRICPEFLEQFRNHFVLNHWNCKSDILPKKDFSKLVFQSKETGS